ncbi:MAG: L-glutamate gamma-semialdehyde dehydrogenase [Rhodothermales bacterium]|nr:L-glutamate gamma-semialdehyde dehydrogenase [Rhodothermales bacterium]MBO6781530.1 L-glutamate gamma-semialdehyde dehydrogenase [Rhodothermales bacterium]
MNNLIPQTPTPVNEPVNSYAPGTARRASLKKRLAEMMREQVDIPAFIGGKEIRTGKTQDVRPPHNTAHKVGVFHEVGEDEIKEAIQSSVDARREWANMDWQDRAAIMLKAADLLAGPWRDTMNAATMVGQSKNAYQAEIDAACELIDFLRFNVHYMQQIYRDQPNSSPGIWNRVQYRGLEGFVFAVTPFNFTAIAGNLPTAPAMMGNSVVWKPASTQMLSAYYFYRIMEEAGLPPGVINMIPGPGRTVGQHVFSSPHLSGLHFTGSTGTFQHMWNVMAQNLPNYGTYPRIVGETGGKDFIFAHPSCDNAAVATAIVRGAFEYQGQKCSAASRVYIPSSCWGEIKDRMVSQLEEIKMGPVDDFSNFVNAVIDAKAFQSITGYIDGAKANPDVEVLFGGNYSDEEGYFIEPTVLVSNDPKSTTMCEEIFGPVVTIYVYEDADFDTTLQLLDETSPYALTGAIFAQDRRVIADVSNRLIDNAGNFYINDKPTGAVVGQQPFGGARASGTNDKAGSYLNLIRWVSARSVKENFNPPHHFAYPFMQPDE